ncbi:MAG: response regulator [Acidobacteriia bacterium]|nr:response regulator [Terriglobia bacterium]
MLFATMAEILLVGRGWQTRALLRAQLIEEGLEVEAFETVGEALATAENVALGPSLLVADLSSSKEPQKEIERLAAWSGQVPIWIIAGRGLLADPQLKGRGFELILARPIDMGQFVEQIKRRVRA